MKGAADIDGGQRVPGVVGNRGQVREVQLAGRAGVVHQIAQTAEAFRGCLGRRRQLRLNPHVGADGDRRAAEGFDRRHRFEGGVAAPSVDHRHPCAATRQGKTDGAADSRAAAGDEGARAREEIVHEASCGSAVVNRQEPFEYRDEFEKRSTKTG